MESNRTNDMIGEQAFDSYMDAYFYDRLTHNGEHIKYERVTDKDKQVRGADVIIQTGDGEIVADEKAATDYRYKMLMTYSFECFTMTGKGEHKHYINGWFIKNGMLTTHYVLSYPHCKLEYDENNVPHIVELDELKMDSFESAVVLLINKERLKRYIDTKYGYERMMQKARELRDMAPQHRKGDRIHLIGGMRLVKSNLKWECPVNLVIPINMLLEVAKGHVYSVTPIGSGTISDTINI